MLLKSKEIAFLGIIMAFSVILVTLGGYLEASTLFFLAAAAFLAGIIERNFSLAVSCFFLAGSVLLSFFLAPQKLYVGTFAAFGVYVITAEYFEKQIYLQRPGKSRVFSWGIKAAVYHILLLVACFFMKEIVGIGALRDSKFLSFLMESRLFLILSCFFAAELFWLVFDRAYIFFMRQYSRFFMIDRYL